MMWARHLEYCQLRVTHHKMKLTLYAVYVCQIVAQSSFETTPQIPPL